MAQKCTLPSGTVVLVEDLPLQVLGEVTEAAGLAPTQWFGVCYSPGAYPRAAVELLKACAAHVGEPEPPDDYLTARNVLEVFSKIREPGENEPEATPEAPDAEPAHDDT